MADPKKYIPLLYLVKYISAIILTFFYSTAIAQNENWDTYMAKFGNKPGSVLVDLALMDNAPDKKYPNLVITGPRAHKCNKDGLPNTDEIDQLEEILDATGSFLTGVTPKVLVGTLTYNCERVNYYYVKDTVGIRNALNRLYTRTYKDYKYAISIKSDPDWTTYRTFLYPDDTMLNWMENDKVITKLIQSGDSLTQPRDIVFHIGFRTEAECDSFATFVSGKGYSTKALQMALKSDNVTDFPWTANVSKRALVKMDTINAMAAELKKAAKQYHGTYDGWQAPLMPKER